MFLQQETDEARVQDILENLLPEAQDYLESQVPSDGFMFGEIGIADISLMCPFINGELVDYRVDAGRWPKLANYIERVKSHPVVAKELQAEAEEMAQMNQ